MSGGRIESEGDTESKAGSRVWAVSTEPDAGLELMDHEIMTWAQVGRLTDWATQTPLPVGFKKAARAQGYVCRPVHIQQEKAKERKQRM